jgi:hypothetical protein
VGVNLCNCTVWLDGGHASQTRKTIRRRATLTSGIPKIIEIVIGDRETVALG